MKQKAKLADDNSNQEIIDELLEIEAEISDQVAVKNRKKVVDNFGSLARNEGALNVNGMWALQKKIFPKNPPSLPTAKIDVEGRILTSHKDLLNLYSDTFIHRLRSRPMNEEFMDLFHQKEQLCELRLELSKKNKSPMWTKSQLLEVLSSLKNNKSRDPHGIVNELFKPGVAGDKLISSLLIMLNRIKSEIMLPEFMRLSNICSIYKGRGERMSLESDRGIFIVNLFRNILMKMVYKDKYLTVDSSMSDSNVGARKKKSIRNHIFIVNGVINEALRNKSKCIDIQIMDYRQCFDSMWLKECVNDLYDSGITDDNLGLIFEANRLNKVAVNTPAGLTTREDVHEIVLQGEVFGPLQCSVQVDTFGKECLKEGKHLYAYKNCVGIPPLAMVDDLLSISECGVETVKTNAFLNSKTNLKKLQFGGDKCHKIHIGQKKYLCPDLFVDSWKLAKDDENKTGIRNMKDIFVGDFPVGEKDTAKYLGDYICFDGTNTKTVKDRKAKGQGVVNKILSILEETCFGPFFFECAVILRNSLLISSVLTNSEAWYGLTKIDVETLESVDEQLLRRIFEVPFSCPKEMIYLETGCLPISSIIFTRRILFLHYILHEDENSLMYRFLQSQLASPVKGDWVIDVMKNIEELGIKESLEEIKSMSIFKFRRIVVKAVRQKTFKDLNNLKNSHNKVKHIEYEKFEMQKYLKNPALSNHEAKFAFHARCRMLEVRKNYAQSFVEHFCPICRNIDCPDTQPHLLECECLESDNVVVADLPDYEQLFSDDVEKQVAIIKLLKNHFDKRKKLIDEEKRRNK